MLAFGAATGGIVAGWFGVYTAFVIDALTFFLSAYFILQIVYKPKQSMEEPSSAGIRKVYTDYVQGVRYLGQHRDIFVIATQKLFASMQQLSSCLLLRMLVMVQLVVGG